MRQPLDVAIVGGGIAGLYCAWRLRRDAPYQGGQRPAVGLFECSHRLGGRIASFTAPGMPNLVGEMGAMQFLSTHPIVSSLTMNRLGLKVQPSPLDKTFYQEAPDNILYTRGVRLRLSEATNAVLLPYNLNWSERGSDPTMLLASALDQLFPGVTAMNGAQMDAFLTTAVLDGTPLYEWGFWNMLNRVLSHEACQFIRDGLGYDFLLNNYNAACMIKGCIGLFPPITYYAIDGGFSQLPNRLAQEFIAEGGDVRTGTRLTSIAPDERSGAIRLSFSGALPDQPGEPAGVIPQNEETVLAQSVVLAMPQSALKAVRQRYVPPATFDQVSPLSIVKVFLCYSENWWKPLVNNPNMAYSDLPVQQCTYWGVDKATHNGLLMAALADTENASFWKGLPRTPEPGAAAPVELPGTGAWNHYTIVPSSDLVAEAHSQLLKIHGLFDVPAPRGLSNVPAPYAAAFANWSASPYGGAAHYWKHGIPYWDAARAILQPNSAAPIFICGEAYSTNQGWVEGALETAEQVLTHPNFPFRVSSPSWLRHAAEKA